MNWRLPSWLLVALQFGLIGALVLTTAPLATTFANAAAFGLVVLGTFVGVAALAANPLGNFNIRPEVKPGARLAFDGIYRHIRHPMYCAVLLVMLAALAADPRAWRIGLWLALLAVLLAKALREEGYLRTLHPDYAEYAARTRRLIPGLF